MLISHIFCIQCEGQISNSCHEGPPEGSNSSVTDTESKKPRFLPILGYVLGFMAAMAVLALFFVWLARVL